ncbi:MAG: hypothetical protein GC204_12530 [Chloroflexi bacterium]|nr:hypothetical protein [Chloroflexota bacterium]
MNHFRSPVKRAGAERYQLITLVSFAASVVLTRIYLELTGYPQIGSGVLHIAHVLWGGLLLFVAALLPLLIANRWVYKLSAVLSGIGVGLFIDEVGKFITANNDYFFPFAAPIIYAFFMLTVTVYIQVRRPSRHDSRAELYHALDEMMELIENDLDAQEQADLEARLQRIVADAMYPEHARLAEALLAVINSDTLQLVESRPNLFQRLMLRLEALESRIFTEVRYRWLLILGLAVAGVGLLIEVIAYAFVLISPNSLNLLVIILLGDQRVTGPTSLVWFIILIVLSGLVGAMLLAGSALIFIGRRRLGSEIGYLGVIVELTTVSLLLFYFNQFAAVGTTLWEFVLLIGLTRYRLVYLGVGSQINVLSNLSNTTTTPFALDE